MYILIYACTYVKRCLYLKIRYVLMQTIKFVFINTLKGFAYSVKLIGCMQLFWLIVVNKYQFTLITINLKNPVLCSITIGFSLPSALYSCLLCVLKKTESASLK